MSRPATALVSDDLTGALDSAVPFAVAGWRVVVATGPGALDRALAVAPDVLALSLNSRDLPEDQAVARARQAAAALAAVPVLFKKIDSRMKGHVRAEVLEIARARGVARVVLCPAIPELGRPVAGGHVTGHGVAVPIPVALAPVAGIAVACPDARTDADLDRIAADCADALPAGARGLAAALARRAGRPATPGAPPARLRGPVTLVIGSRDPVTLDQADRLRAAVPGAAWIAAPDGAVPPAPRTAGVVILQATDGGGGADGATVARRLAAGLAAHLRPGGGTLVLTGGETAAACLAALGIGVLHLTGEVLPGLPVSVPLDFPGAPNIVTKSGGFGDPDCLATLVRAATGGR
ncbi:MAG: hypothetical protein MUF73_04065 [Rhodobacteraceae bacterium]|jgi:uncharacterized protein YgbK (DUF1537 family)|nr:hypothetical protein [Paracoccaceae bacterium]